jgi:hypothetical protein
VAFLKVHLNLGNNRIPLAARTQALSLVESAALAVDEQTGGRDTRPCRLDHGYLTEEDLFTHESLQLEQ